METEVTDQQVDEVTETEAEAEPSGESEPEPTSTEGEAEAEAEGTSEPGAQADAEGAEETDDDWLPSEQEKEFPLATLLEFANKRYGKLGLTAELVEQNPGIQEMLKQNLNAEILARSGAHAEADEEAEGFVLPDDEEEASEETTETATATDSDPRKAHYQAVDAIVGAIDQKEIEEFGREVLGAMQVNVDPKLIEQQRKILVSEKATPQQRQAAQDYINLVSGAGNLGKVMARRQADFLLSVMPRLLPQMIEQAFPGSTRRHQVQMAAEYWSELKGTKGKDGKPMFSNLPAFGTDQYRALLQKVERQLGFAAGGLAEMQFSKNGRPLTAEQRDRALLRMVAKVASGQRLDPALVNQAAEAGKTAQKKADQRRKNAGALGSGQTAGGRRALTGNEDIFGAGVEEYKRRGG